ncbi:Porphobilinogen deaminase [bacterium HR40]|nr:Porphobilinogen deaminase [bacterium HR40]
MKKSARIVIGSRGSPLALAQARMVREALAATVPGLAAEDAIAIEVIHTTGDRFLDRPLAAIGGKGLFTKEIEEALLAQRIDLAVHSLKDMPTRLPEGLVIGACLPRADVRDALIGRPAVGIADLPQGAVVGTASLRRAAQLLARRPDLRIVPLRGNVHTRLRKVWEGEVTATLLAAAGLDRLGLLGEASVILSVDEMLPAVGQGAIGVECRADDAETLDMLALLDHVPTRQAVEVERAFLARLEGSCRTPIAALCTIADGEAHLRGLVASPDGRFLLRIDRRVSLREAVGAAEEAADRLRRSVPPV